MDTIKSIDENTAYEIDTQTTYVSIMGRDGTQKKIIVPVEKVEQFKKIMEATMPDIFDENDDL